MTEQEKINFETQKQLAMQDAKFAMFMQEAQQQREDIRRLHERQDAMQAKHDADIKALQAKQDADMKALQAKHDANMKKIDEKFDRISEQINNTWRQTMLGVGGMIVALGALLVTTSK